MSWNKWIFQLTAPRGGRLPGTRDCDVSAEFQLTAPRGGRRWALIVIPCHWQFQLTAPRGGRHLSSSGVRGQSDFNSRPRKGADDLYIAERGWQQISTHGPARGPTVYEFGVMMEQKDFNSRPRKGADRPGHRDHHIYADFNSRPRKGADQQHPEEIP